MKKRPIRPASRPKTPPRPSRPLLVPEAAAAKAMKKPRPMRPRPPVNKRRKNLTGTSRPVAGRPSRRR